MTSPDVLNAEPVGRPLRADAERNRQRLLAAGREVFAERGLDATLDEVAARAGVGIGTAYRRFANKEELIEGIFELRMDGIVAAAEECAAAPDAGEGFFRFLHETCASMAADRGIRDVLLHGTSGMGKLSKARNRLLPATTRLVERAQAAGAIRPDFRPTDLPMVIFMVEAVANATDRVDPELWRRYLGLLLDGMRIGGSPVPVLPGHPLTADAVEHVMTQRAPGRR
jgi:AcrR family transcriptional regulator